MKTFKAAMQLILFISALAWLTPIGEGRGGVGRGGGRNSSAKSGSTSRKVAGGALVGGLGSYAAYRTWDKNTRGPNSGPDPEGDSGLAYSENFNVLSSTYSQRREGSGMSAWSLIMVILGLIGGVTVLWYCYSIGLPLWRDRQAGRRRSYQLTSVNVKSIGDDMPLHETPSTATPSP